MVVASMLLFVNCFQLNCRASIVANAVALVSMHLYYSYSAAPATVDNP